MGSREFFFPKYSVKILRLQNFNFICHKHSNIYVAVFKSYFKTCQFSKNFVLILSLKHATISAYLLAMAADFRAHRRCADHGLTADTVHTALNSLVALDAPTLFLRYLTHATRGWCNSHRRNTFQSFCNTAKHLSVFIIQCFLLSSAPPHIWENVFQLHLQNEVVVMASPLVFRFLYCVPFSRFMETARQLGWQLKLIRGNNNTKKSKEM